MVLIQDRILKIDIYNFEMSYKTPEKSLKSNQIYSVVGAFNQQKALVGAFSVIVQPVVEPMDRFAALFLFRLSEAG